MEPSKTFLIAIAALTTGPWVTTALPQASDDYRVMGSPEAPVEMAVFSDFECPFCRNFALAAVPAIVAEFVDTGQLRLRYVFFPLAASHRNAVATAKAAHCAGLSGRFWAYHDYLFVRQPEWSRDTVTDDLWTTYAENLGMDGDAFAACFRSDESHAAVEADLRLALAAGVTGTPTIALNGEPIAGFETYEALRQEIRGAIEGARR